MKFSFLLRNLLRNCYLHVSCTPRHNNSNTNTHTHKRTVMCVYASCVFVCKFAIIKLFVSNCLSIRLSVSAVNAALQLRRQTNAANKRQTLKCQCKRCFAGTTISKRKSSRNEKGKRTNAARFRAISIGKPGWLTVRHDNLRQPTAKFPQT